MAPPNVNVQLVEKPTDPLAVALTGGDISLLPVLARAMIKPIALQIGDMYTATDENGKVVGFQMWVPPGRLLFNTYESISSYCKEEQRKLGFEDFLSQLSDEAKLYCPQTLGKDFPHAIDILAGMDQTELNTYWCNFNFVAEDWWQKGISKAMTGLAYRKAKANGWTMALATTHTRNVDIYKRLGFELKGLRDFTSPWNVWQAWIYVWKTKED
ncbi:hypothetical protein IEO21_07516 [Rhodonia placenta]|uniref:N-acetyltransferase domain-containing protein n=1 Tax=Rhodonia placenta TaxID=104341 RepID=A0A8H7NXV3_9APHY|nr:hypothetical protein IEO21_07516 [Postia placenta]